MNVAPLSRLLTIAMLICAAVLAFNQTSANARPAIPISKPAPQNRLKFDTTKFVSESELRYGQRAYALTVFRGQKIERFNVEILGVLKKVNNGEDLIAFRAMDGPSVSRHLNIAHGMSGSPVYIGKRLVGAIAYGLPFGREPIGLITPISDMLDSWDPDLPKEPSLSTDQADRGLTSMSVSSAQLMGAFGSEASSIVASSPSGQITLEPMMTPVSVSGLSPENIAYLATKMAPLHLLPVTGGGAPDPDDANVTPARLASAIKTFQPGAAVAVSLAEGDVDMSAIGTVTYRDADRVLIFGHPFMGIGPIDAALKTASITELFPSYEDSTKLGMPGITVGRIFQDRPFSVGGEIGPRPEMIPVDVSVNDESDQRIKTFHSRVINHPLLTGALVLTVVNEAVLEMHGTPGDAVAYVTTDVDAEQVGHIVRSNVYFDPLSINSTAVSDLNDIVQLLSANPFYQLGVKSVSVKVVIQNRHSTAVIDHVVVPRSIYQPGETVNVGVVLKPYKQDSVVKTISLKIPTSAPDGSVILSVRGGAESAQPTISVNGNGSISVHQGAGFDSTTPPPANVSQLVKQFLEQPKNNDLVASLALPRIAPEVGGEKLTLLPPTMLAIMRAQHASGLRILRDDVKSTTPVEWVVDGSQQIQITIQKKLDLEDSSVSNISPPSSTTVINATGVADSTPDSVPPTPVSTDGISGETNALSAADTMAIPPIAPVAPQSHPDPGATPPAPPDASTSITTSTSTSSWTPMTGDDSSATRASSTDLPVSRNASIWRQSTESAFDNGTLDGVAVTNAPDVRLSPSIKQLATTNSSYVWSQVYDSAGNLYMGTGDDGLIYKLSAGSTTPQLFARTKELEVTSLVYNDATSTLYAATAPHGTIFAIRSGGSVIKLATLKEPYIPAILLGKDGRTLYAATAGGTGQVFAVSLASPQSAAAPQLLFTSPDTHLLCLAQGPDGSLYTGGNPNGVVYKLDPTSTTGKGQIVYDSPGPTISALAVASDGSLYVGTSPTGSIYKVKPPTNDASITPQVAKTVIARTSDFVSDIAIDNSGSVWASAGDTIYRVAPGVHDTISTFPSDPSVTYTSIAVSPGGAVTAGTASIGRVFGTTQQAAKTVVGSYISPVHDAQLKSKWGSINWVADTPKGSSIAILTRSGDVPEPDKTWSDWSQVAASSDSSAGIESPSSRFIQYQADLTQNADSTAAPLLKSVSVYYLSQNRPPSVHVISPFSGEALSSTATLRWSGVDPDRDTLQYNLFYSSDDGATWQKLDTGAPIRQKAPAGNPLAPTLSTPRGSGSRNAASNAVISRKLAEEMDKHPEIPTNVRAQILAQATATAMAAIAQPSTSATSMPAPPVSLRSSTYSWDTKTLHDGTYRFKVVASDAPSNAVGSLTDESISDPFIVVNTQPKIVFDPVTQNADSTVVQGTATTNIVFVKAVQYSIDGGAWLAAAPVSGLFDSTNERFQCVIQPALTGTHHITVEVFDRAGNMTSQSVDTK